MKGYGDICKDCLDEYKILERLIDYILDNDLKIEIQKNEYRNTKYKKDDIRICFNCGKEIQESKMGKMRTMMGDGYYPSKCPYCEAAEKLFGETHKSTDKFKMIKIEDN